MYFSTKMRYGIIFVFILWISLFTCDKITRKKGWLISENFLKVYGKTNKLFKM